MYNVSSRFQRVISQPGREFRYRATVLLRSGQTMKLDGHDIMEGGLSVDQTSSVLGQFALGDVTASELNLQLNNYTGQFEGIDFDGAMIMPYVGLIVEQHYEKGAVPEWVKMGSFYAEAADTRGPVVDLKAYDGMMRFAIPYSQCKLSYPATLLQILLRCCLDCGVPLRTYQFTNYDYVVTERPEDGALTYRDVVSYVAALAGCFTRLTPDGSLELAWYDMEHPVAEFKNVTNFWAQDLTITGVKVGPYREGEPTYIRGEEDYTLDIFDNPLAQENRDVLCRAIGDKINGFTFRPFQFTGLSNPALNAGDAAVFYDRKGNQYKTVITYTLFRIGSNQKYTAEAQTPAVKNFSFFGPIAKAKEDLKSDTKKQISAYDTLAKQFASMTANSMGFYMSVEKQDDGSEIWYQHDKEKLEESKVIWKKSLDTMAVSTDGGKTWMGVDKNGNAVLNVLAAHGIVADWIKTGTIQSEANPNVQISLDGEDIKLQTSKGKGLTVQKDGDAVFTGRIEAEGATFQNTVRWGASNKPGEYCDLDLIDGVAILHAPNHFYTHYMEVDLLEVNTSFSPPLPDTEYSLKQQNEATSNKTNLGEYIVRTNSKILELERRISELEGK